MSEKAQKHVVFKETVSALGSITRHKRVPLIKTVKAITIHWPSACTALVDVAVGYSKDKRLLPEEGYLALDLITFAWSINRDIEDDTLWVEIKNGTASAVTISVIVSYEEA